MDVIALISRTTPERVVVVGSLPPGGRDVDLVVRPAAGVAIASALGAAGFVSNGRMWARFDGCRVDAVELAPAESWGLPEAELLAFFDESSPLGSTGRVCRPAPHHVLLILARRVMREGPRLREKRARRIAEELERDPAAFETAAQRAPLWGAARALEALAEAQRSGDALPVRLRRRAIAEELRSRRGRLGAWLGSWRAVLRRPRRGDVIAFSGLDGCGKSSQAAFLAETLAKLGTDTIVVWTSVAFHPPWLGRLARFIKRLLSRIVAGRRRGTEAGAQPAASRASNDSGKALRQRSSILTFVWSLTVVTLQALEVARKVWPPLLRGRTVVCDRYLLDSWAHLLYQYGQDRSYRLQLALLRLVFPRPVVSYLLDVSPEAASARKVEYTVDQNRRRRVIYREKAGELGARTLDGDRPLEELCEEIASETWAATSG